MSTKRKHAGSHGGSKASHSNITQVDAAANSPSLERTTVVHGREVRDAVDIHAATIADRESNGALQNYITIENKPSSTGNRTTVVSGTEDSSSSESKKERSGPEMQATSLTLAVEAPETLNNKYECGDTSSSPFSVPPFPVAAPAQDTHGDKKRRRGRGNGWARRKSYRKAKADCTVQVGSIKSPPAELLRKASVCNLMQLAEAACVSEREPLKGNEEAKVEPTAFITNTRWM